ncbi:MAG: hypothetical protein AAF193_11670, partial [Bacteroidota bacterium]
AIDSNGGVYVVGGFTGLVNFDPNGEAEITTGEYGNTCIAHYESNGAFDFVVSISGGDTVIPVGVEVDAQDNVYVTGTLSGEADFDPSSEELIVSNDVTGNYLAKYASNGEFIWAWSIEDAHSTDLEVLEDGTCYLVGSFSLPVDLDPGMEENSFQPEGVDSFIIKTDNDGSHIWGFVFSGENNDYIYGVTTDNADGVYVCGGFRGVLDVDPSDQEVLVVGDVGTEYFVTKLDDNGEYQWESVIQNIGDGQFLDIDYDDLAGNVSVTGMGYGTHLFPNNLEINPSGEDDIMNVSYSSSGEILGVLMIGGTSEEVIETGNAHTRNGVLTIGGSYPGTIDFSPNETEQLGPPSQGSQDLFLARYST